MSDAPDPGELHVPDRPVRVVTAASLFDGHDASINIMRRLLQAQGAEVIHLGHNRSVEEVVTAAICEDVHAVAVSSYQGGHVEYFGYLVDELAARGAGHVRVYGGGGGVITPEEIDALHARGVARIFSPQDGQRMGLARMVNLIIAESDVDLVSVPDLDEVLAGDHRALARLLTAVEAGRAPQDLLDQVRERAAAAPAAVLGVTGTGGSGKSSLTDELIRRVRLDQEDKVPIAVLAVDPTRRRTGGALLGDRIRMNAIDGPHLFYRSLATRGARGEVPDALDDLVAACKAAGHRLVIVETPGIGQGDDAVVDHVDVPLYVMTPEFGAASQLEKIEMLDAAEAVAINKFERRGAQDAFRDVRRHVARLRGHSGDLDDLPVFGTIASRFNDDGVTALYQHLRDALAAATPLALAPGALAPVSVRTSSTAATSLIPPPRVRYLAEISETVRAHHARTADQSAAARRRQQLVAARDALESAGRPTDDLDALVADAEAPSTRRPSPSSTTGPTPSRRSPATGTGASPSPAPRCPASRCPASAITASWCGGSGPRTCRDGSRSPRGCSPSGGPRRTPPGCSPARATRPARTAATTSSPRGCRPPGCRWPSTRSPSTASTPTSAPTSTARSATPGSRCAPSTTWPPSSRASTCATRPPRCP
jgi:isobutyryl-CoA mutase